MNVFRPETLQRLVELKISYKHSFYAEDLHATLTTEPFSEEADQKLNRFIDSVWQQLNVRSLLVEAVKSASEKENNEPVSVEHVRVAFNHMHTDDEIPNFSKKKEVRDLLVELASPFTGCLRRKYQGNQERFYFLRKLEIGT
ncbi:hypothetical protein N836_25820 [Leptolyngbya sp. Heron Island J]|uniref:hypothetical protein n=1 Tax=Leptolyngbya sp. Heron Island J TaxID=1385935 RepID=UPI0003B96069|nr:hypothetical protein [Leptolyngbya sp. Heron Island J]ESA32737.1 hypothetical protein N836_25820 [Leptolyngbya sp. Heron Island J]